MMLSLPTWPLKEQLRFGQQRYRGPQESIGLRRA